MSSTVEALLVQSIALEQNASRLYAAFSRLFEPDRVFWNRLAAEERNHAALLQTLRSELTLLEDEAEANLLFTESIASIVASNDALNDLITSLEITEIAREKAFEIALSLETGTGEKHLHVLAERLPSNTLEEVIHVLLDADRKHAERIRSYAKHNGFVPVEQERQRPDQ